MNQEKRKYSKFSLKDDPGMVWTEELFQHTYFVKCRRTLLDLNSQAPYRSTVRGIKFRRCLFIVYVLRKTRNQACSRRSRAKTGREMYKKAWCTCKVVVLLIKPIVFLTFSLPSASWDLKVRILAGKRGSRRHSTRELKMETFSGRRRPDRQRKPGTEAAVASRQKSNIKIAVNSEGRRL